MLLKVSQSSRKKIDEVTREIDTTTCRDGIRKLAEKGSCLANERGHIEHLSRFKSNFFL